MDEKMIMIKKKINLLFLSDPYGRNITKLQFLKYTYSTFRYKPNIHRKRIFSMFFSIHFIINYVPPYVKFLIDYSFFYNFCPAKNKKTSTKFDFVGLFDS